MNPLRKPRWIPAILIIVVAASLSAAERPAWPEVTNETKPWSRWWWLGSILPEDGLKTEMEKYAAAGLGGLEITPIYGVQGYEDQFIDYLTPTWMDRFELVLNEAQRLDLGIDMATGNGWPFGGPWVGEETAAKYLAHKTYTVAVGGRLSEPVQYIETPVVRYAGPARPTIDEIKDPISANTNLQEMALDQVRFPKPQPLHTLMAFPESGGEPLNLTDRVAADGMLDWQAPAGSGAWTLYAIFTALHGKMVERAGPGGEGNVIDHFNRAASHQYLAKFDAAFVGRDVSALRGFFNDSYEVDDAQGESNFTDAFFTEFERRRGYDLRSHLPALFADANSDENSRVLSDYRETISDLLLDEFTRPWAEWAAGHGALVRNQAHGSPANILDLYAASGIPEQEGNDVLGLKMAASAAHVTGKRLASSETATWLNEHFFSTLADAKERIDTTFLGGLNHICYHGTPFSPPDAEWPGFLFYASVNFAPTNSFWAHFPALNAYATRAQSFLQAGLPDEDVLLYYNIHDRWAERGNGAMPHFHGRSREGMTVQAVAGELYGAGYGFDYFSDRMLAAVRFADGTLQAGGAHYRAIVVPETKLMPANTVVMLFELAQRGATVIFENAFPADVPGLGRLNMWRQDLQVFKEAFVRSGSTEYGVTTLPWGKGRVVVGSDVLALLAAAGAKPEPMVSRGLRYVRRRDDDGSHYFIVNEANAALDGWVPLATPAAVVEIFNPMTGESGVAAARDLSDGGSEVYLRLQPGESTIVKMASNAVDAASYAYWRPTADPVPVAGTWSVIFNSGGPTLPAPQEITALGSWTKFAGEAGEAFSGTATYAIDFDWPSGDASAFRLSLGQVAESARVSVNSQEIGTVFAEPFEVRIPAEVLQPTGNRLEIEVANLMLNHIRYLDRSGVRWQKFYNTNMPARRRDTRGPDGNFSAANLAPLESGLLGPVMLTPLNAFRP